VQRGGDKWEVLRNNDERMVAIKGLETTCFMTFPPLLHFCSFLCDNTARRPIPDDDTWIQEILVCRIWESKCISFINYPVCDIYSDVAQIARVRTSSQLYCSSLYPRYCGSQGLCQESMGYECCDRAGCRDQLTASYCFWHWTRNMVPLGHIDKTRSLRHWSMCYPHVGSFRYVS
jgi:hypothetical protein